MATMSDTDRAATVAANGFTTAWCGRSDGTSTVFSGAGVWPLLAFLSSAAEGPAQAELAAATGVPAGTAHEAARAVLSIVDASSAVRAGFGAWTRYDVPLTDWWRRAVPGGGILTGRPTEDQARLDAWVHTSTQGRITQAPIETTDETLLVLMTALALRTTWRKPFEPTPIMFAGADGSRQGLARTSTNLDEVALADTAAGPLTMFTVRGQDDVDVILVLGAADRPAGQVLAAGCNALAKPVTPGSRLPSGTVGPGLTVRDVRSLDPTPLLITQTVAFTVRARHELLADLALFGLATAVTDGDHFPRISPEPIKINAAAQEAVAGFTAEGFYGEAVTEFALVMGSGLAHSTTYRREVAVTIDRPFGFLAEHRPTGLILFAGWITEPDRADGSRSGYVQ